jgi:hypothetical protein
MVCALPDFQQGMKVVFRRDPMKNFVTILIICVLSLGNTAHGEDLTTMEGIAAYAYTNGKTECSAGNNTIDSAGDISVFSACDNDTARFILMGFSPQGEYQTVTIDGAIFVNAQIGLGVGTGTGTPETFPYHGKVSPDSYILLRSKAPQINAWCLITPNAGTGSSATITETGWSTERSFTEPWFIHCESIDGAVIESIWPFPMVGLNSAEGKAKKQDRGMYCLGPFDFVLARGSSDTFEN